ncbi:MAG TPA: hypothetical protein VFL82_00045 [Thermomicrobiales bacterium]|nr:hypothetical protein [Thermomicrobiales bacterium]
MKSDERRWQRWSPVWGKAALVCVVMMLALITVPVAAQGVSPAASPISSAGVTSAAKWLVSHQAKDGSYAGLDGKPDAGATADAIIALAAAKAAGAEVDLTRPLAYLTANALVYAQTGPGQAAMLTLAVVAAGGNPRDVAKVNPVALISHSANKDTHLYGFGVYDHALIMLALQAAGETIPPEAITALQATQIDNGSWAFDASTEAAAGDSNTTAVVIQALAATGHGDDPMVTKGLEFLKTLQADNGGFAYQPANPLAPDANSTALVVQAIIAAGQDPASSDWRNAASALVAFQNSSGAFHYSDAQPDDNFLATIQALPPLAGLPMPVIGPPVEGTPVASPAAGA